MKDSKKRFSDRVNDYKRYRPLYPDEALEYVKHECAIDGHSKIADVGSGTGISTKAMIENYHCHVYAVEPNEKMRLEAESALGGNPLFTSINGSSEDTKLADHSVTMVTAFQAFHWFDSKKAHVEFKRILKEQKWVVLVWNDRVTKSTPFLEGYEGILQMLPEYSKVNHKNTEKLTIEKFIGTSNVNFQTFPNSQKFDLDGLMGRFFSSSYTPSIGTVEYDEQVRKLETLFNSTNDDGLIEFKYQTQIYLGRME